jgi:hypothetical protein
MQEKVETGCCNNPLAREHFMYHSYQWTNLLACTACLAFIDQGSKMIIFKPIFATMRVIADSCTS